MPKPRHTQVPLDTTTYYHCVSRCVHHAFLCGIDTILGQSYEHRRHWIENKLYELDQVFALDLCAYAVMSNHYHVVLYVDADQAESWSREKVIVFLLPANIRNKRALTPIFPQQRPSMTALH